MNSVEAKKQQDPKQNKDVRKDDIQSPWKVVWRRLKKNKLAIIGLYIIIAITILSICAPLFGNHRRDAIDFTKKYQAPSKEHWLGTDVMGRDIYTRLLYAGRVSLSVGFVSTGIRIIIGLFIGGVAGYYGGKIDNLLMRFTDIVSCFPFFIIAITVVAILGPGIYKTMVVLGILGWPGIARIVRGEILSLREREFMEAATALGISDRRKIMRHLLPNTMASVIVNATMGIAGAILTEAALSYLGLGVQIPTPTWGNILGGARSLPVIQNYWWIWVTSGSAILITVMSLNFLGDGLRDALDPRLKQ